MTTRIYGASDDLVEMEGDINNEVCGYNLENGFLMICSDGTFFQIKYGELGIWKINVALKGSLFDHLGLCTDADDDPYSDQLFFKDGLKWIYAAKEWERVK